MKHLKWKIARAIDICAEAAAASFTIAYAVSWVVLVLGAPFIVLALFAKLMGWL